MKLYLDGCSLVYGQGLPRESSLGSLFATQGKYDVTDVSRPGKSNMAIALDTYKNYQNFDVIILGFTYSSRFHIKYRDQNIDFFAGSHGRGLGLEPDNLDLSFKEVYKFFYSIYGPPYSDDLSDMLVDTLISFLMTQSKKVLAFSWENRKVKNLLRYPYFSFKDRLDDGHLNIKGTEKLFHYLQNILDE